MVQDAQDAKAIAVLADDFVDAVNQAANSNGYPDHCI